MLGLADARQISDKMVVLPMAAQHLLPLMNGERSVGDIVNQIGKGLTAPILQGLIAQLQIEPLRMSQTAERVPAQPTEAVPEEMRLPANAGPGIG